MKELYEKFYQRSDLKGIRDVLDGDDPVKVSNLVREERSEERQLKNRTQAVAGCSFLFVYGTLMRGFHEDLQEKVGAKLVGEGTIRAKLYDLGDYPGAKLAGSSSENLVKGELYRLRDGEGASKILDQYEDYLPSAPRRSLFIRQLVTVTLENGRKRKAWTYLYNRPVDDAKLIPSGSYRDRVLARHWS